MKLTVLLMLLTSMVYGVGTEPGTPNLDQPERLVPAHLFKKASEARRLAQANEARILAEQRTNLRLMVKADINKAIAEGYYGARIGVADFDSSVVKRQMQELVNEGYKVEIKPLDHYYPAQDALEISW